ncbi:MAG: hypothetical protein GY714_23470 [Desulfobacterales bacterium]|nr:hypothetical protein [Desulfobacterales bacterium]
MDNIFRLGDKTFTIQPIKMKYMKNNFYNYYLLLKKYGLIKILNFKDGLDIVNYVLQAIFDNNEDNIGYAKEELDNSTLNELLDIVKKENEIDDEEDLKNV